ncbi:MAG: hypothetical protein ACRDIU_09300 [Actinomycetota bacterium]
MRSRRNQRINRARKCLSLVAVALLTAACGNGKQSAGGVTFDDSGSRTKPAASASPPGATPSLTAGPVPEILGFTAPRVGGGRVVGADFAGKDVAAWFWAPW